jgi:hypothetical protein
VAIVVEAAVPQSLVLSEGHRFRSKVLSTCHDGLQNVLEAFGH